MRTAIGLLATVAVLTAAAAGRQLPSAAAPSAAQSQELRVEDVLRAASAYLAAYEQTIAIEGQEEYTQEYSQQIPLARRMLRSDILFMPDDTFGWVEFRDVAAQDGIPVRDRGARLLALFTKPHADRLKQAQRIVAEGARFNFHPPGARVNRTLNLPLTALRFLRGADQYRSAFRIADWNRRTDVVAVEFTEQHRPRLIGTPDERAATGRFDIDRTTGRVTASSLTQQSGVTAAMIVVKFSHDV